MPSYAEFVEQAGNRVLDVVRPLQDVVAHAVQVADNFASKLPAVPFASTLPNLPSGREVVIANFDLVERLVASQRAFALRLVSVSAESTRVFVPAQGTPVQEHVAASA